VPAASSGAGWLGVAGAALGVSSTSLTAPAVMAAMLMSRSIHRIYRAVRDLARFRFAGESRCPRQKWIPVFAGKEGRWGLLNQLNGSER